ncbi:MAG: zinc ABC transporter substrate-binding protein [Firmicutes bacterium]|nr:zinc ABC transporter substrate-binding protein [Bacillota bacterium]
MKKIISFFIAAILLIGILSACSSAENEQKKTEEKKKIQIVTTIFPEYDWVKNILGENPADAEVTLLLDNGVDLHSYQPTADDILKISDCDMFIYVGGESDEWVEDALSEATNKDMKAVNLLEALGENVKEEEIVEGMESEEEEESNEEHEHEHEYDEHVWLSLKNTTLLVDKIESELASIDSQNADIYKKNADTYKEKLNKIDDEYKSAADKANVKTLLFGDRFPFRYLTDDYGLGYYAAFAGCSAETEADFETVVFLANKVDELSVDTILTIDGSDRKIAETIKDNTKTKDQKIMTMDSMQSTTMNDINNGTTYLSVMENNLEVFKEALK